METFEIVTAESLSLALQNAVVQQQLNGIAALAVTVMASAQILGTVVSDGAGPSSEAIKSSVSSKAASPALKAAGQTPDAGVSEDSPATDSVGVVAGAAEDMALQFILQSVALSIQDAATRLANLRTLSTAAFARFLTRLGDTNAPQTGMSEITAVQDFLTQEENKFQNEWSNAVKFLEQHSAKRVAGPSNSEARAACDHGVGMANLSQATLHALSIAAENAVATQQQINVTAQASLTMGVATLYSLDTAATGLEDKKELGKAPV